MNNELAELAAAASAPLGPFTPIVDGVQLLDEVYQFLGRFVAYPTEHEHGAHTLWVAHTHLMDEWDSTPRLAFLSPEPGSGKTRALELTETLVPRPVEAINCTPAYLFRKVSDPVGLPTILFDEIDSLFGPRAQEHEEIRAIINAGHRRGGMAGRCLVKGKTVVTEELPAYAAVALAGLGSLPETIFSRAVIIRMRRRAPTETVEPYRRRVHGPEGNLLRDRLAVWAEHLRPNLSTNPTMPEGITDRNADVWEALLAVADAAGGSWPERARVAAVALVAVAHGGQGSLGVTLLADLKTIFRDDAALWTERIIEKLVALPESPWGDLRGKPLSDRRLAALLRPYGVSSKQIKLDNINQRGYRRDDLLDAWTRYVHSPPEESATDATDATEEAAFEEQ